LQIRLSGPLASDTQQVAESIPRSRATRGPDREVREIPDRPVHFDDLMHNGHFRIPRIWVSTMIKEDFNHLFVDLVVAAIPGAAWCNGYISSESNCGWWRPVPATRE
jgi:hypothetical protein